MNELGFWFALPRLLARFSGRKVRRAEWSRVEAYGLGWLVFLLPCLVLWRAQLAIVRPVAWQFPLFVLVPFAVWIGWLLSYFFVWLLAGFLRRTGLYSARTNNPLQSVFIIAIASLAAFTLLGSPALWLRSLGVFWFTLLLLNFVAEIILRFGYDR